jgi:hypothetical protein
VVGFQEQSAEAGGEAAGTSTVPSLTMPSQDCGPEPRHLRRASGTKGGFSYTVAFDSTGGRMALVIRVAEQTQVADE